MRIDGGAESIISPHLSPIAGLAAGKCNEASILDRILRKRRVQSESMTFPSKGE